MMAEQIANFRQELINHTAAGLLEWEPLMKCPDWGEIQRELDEKNIPVDFGVNTIRISNSFFLKSGEGYVFLFEIFHGDPEVTSPEMDSRALVVKIGPDYPVDNITFFDDEEQEQLRELQLIIENFYDEKHTYPDALYSFFEQVIDPK